MVLTHTTNSTNSSLHRIEMHGPQWGEAGVLSTEPARQRSQTNERNTCIVCRMELQICCKTYQLWDNALGILSQCQQCQTQNKLCCDYEVCTKFCPFLSINVHTRSELNGKSTLASSLTFQMSFYQWCGDCETRLVV